MLKSFFIRTKIKLKRPRYYIPAAILIIILILIGRAVFGGSKNKNVQTRTAAITKVLQEVSATGAAKSADAVDLAFQTGGQIAKINVAVGDRVKAGQVLSSLSNTSESAALDSAQARLDQLINGARLEDLAVSQSSIDSAKISLQNAENSLTASINDGFVKADDAVRNHADKVFNTQGPSPSFGTDITSGGVVYSIRASDINTGINLSNERAKVRDMLNSWPSPLSDNMAGSGLVALDDLKYIQQFLSDTSEAINALSASNQTASDFYTTFKNDISTARTNVSTAITNLQTAIQTYNSQKAALDLAERQYDLKKAPATSEDVLIQRAAVDQALATLNETVITSPIDGIVTKVVGEVGEIVPANSTQISVIADSNLEIEVNIPESDISKVRVGAPANITFDAFGKDFVASATVSSIDPAATVIDGVPTYRTVLLFNNPDPKIKTGMTSNITIKGEERDNVLAIPQRAVWSESGRKYVKVLIGKKIIEKDITTGLRGTDGNIEILSGLSAGDLVVTGGQ